MKTVIVFSEGHSGRFLQAVILNCPVEVASFRISDYLGSSRSDLDIVLTHNVNDISPSDYAFRILPTLNIYNPIYNVFMKKTLIEEFPGFDLAKWVDDPVFWYDKCYYLIQDYHSRIHNDISTNTIQNVIDFDRITNPDYLKDLLWQHFGLEFDNNRCALVKKYSELQLQMDLAEDSIQQMQDILAPITDHMLVQNPWFWAYAVFKFEHNNNLTEQHRLWSIDNFKVPQTRNDLIQYQFLKQTKSNK